MWHLQKLLKTRGLRQTPTQISVIVAKTLIIIQPPATRRHTHTHAAAHLSIGPRAAFRSSEDGASRSIGLREGFSDVGV